MALIHCDFYSATLGIETSLKAIIPLPFDPSDDAPRRDEKRTYPTLFLLHGLHMNYSSWSRFSGIERYANERGLAVIMPDAGRSFYTNMHSGQPYFDFFVEELPLIANQLFPLSTKRSDRFIAGFSMGGYGAFKIALSHPDQYCAAASLSGALSLSRSSIEDPEAMLPDWPIIFGPSGIESAPENDLLHLAEIYAHSEEPRVALFQCCGTEDKLYRSNLDFIRRARELNIDVAFEEEPGDHSWVYWENKIQDVIDWLPVEGVENES